MTSILKVDQLQDSGGNAIITSNGAGSITTASGLNTAITNAGFATTNGITQADMWRLTTNLDLTPAVTDLTFSNLERVDTGNFGYIGTGMTQSGGVFTFPETGIYLINACAVGYNNASASQYIQLIISTTTDNSTYYQGTYTYTSLSASNYYFGVHGSTFFDVTNTSTHKVKFEASSNNTPRVFGSTAVNHTYFQFIRLGDT